MPFKKIHNFYHLLFLYTNY